MLEKQALKSGWGMADITPKEKTLLRGMYYQRISTHTNDPLCANVFALQDAKGELLIWISFDLLCVEREVKDTLADILSREIPGFKKENLICSAIHNHTGPYFHSRAYINNRGGSPLDMMDVPEICLKPEEYVKSTLIPNTVNACREACAGLFSTGFSPVLGHAVIGYCRRMRMRDGSTVMYGDCGSYNFDRPEGPCDHGIEMMYAYDEDKNLLSKVKGSIQKS